MCNYFILLLQKSESNRAYFITFSHILCHVTNALLTVDEFNKVE